MPDVRVPERAAELNGVSETALVNALAAIERNLGAVARRLASRDRLFDEYQPQAFYANDVDSVSTLPVNPEFHYEVVQCIIVTGPVTGNVPFTLTLGARVWNLQLPATGILVMAPVLFRLKESDTRTLTSATPGDWSLELSGYADVS
jgi:hypothetical protein